MTTTSSGDSPPRLLVVDHPLMQDKLTRLRDIRTNKAEFRRLLKEMTLLMGYEIARYFPTKLSPIQTPMTTIEAPVLAKSCAMVAVLRAGLGMMDGFLEILPEALEGHIGLYRDPHTKEAVQYLVKLPDLHPDRLFILLDPMFATGNTAIKAVEVLLNHGVAMGNILFASIIASPEGLAKFHQKFPLIPVLTAAIDQGLDKNSYIIPGLGDAGDRMFGTSHS